MHSNKSRPSGRQNGAALEPQRRHGRLRVAALLKAGASVISEKGFQAATMAEIASRAEAPIGSLYRFFPNKKILGDALLHRFGARMAEAFAEIRSQPKTLSIAALTEALLTLLVELQGEKRAIRALLEAHSDWSEKREEFRRAVLRQIVRTLTLRCPKLSPRTAENMAFVLLQNMKTASTLNAHLSGRARREARAELHEMTRLYLQCKLSGKRPQKIARSKTLR